MKIKTTTIGAYPKPSCTPIGDWFPDAEDQEAKGADKGCLLYTSPSPRDRG